MNLNTSVNQITWEKQPLSRNQTILKADQKVYLYGDRQFRGTLIRPIERTYPHSRIPLRLTAAQGRSPKWTVKLDRGGYEAVNLSDLSLIESPQHNPVEPNPEIPFSDEPQATTSQLEREIIALKRQVHQLKQENEIIKKDLEIAKQVIRRAKDISPIVRLSLKRVLRLAHDACMDVKRTVGGWILKMGDKARKFRRLADIWDILSQDEWYLSEIFAPDKLISPDLIQPPRRIKRPTPAEKQTFPILRPEEVLRRRKMGMPKCC